MEGGLYEYITKYLSVDIQFIVLYIKEICLYKDNGLAFHNMF